MNELNDIVKMFKGSERNWEKEKNDHTPRVINMYASPIPVGAVYIGRPNKMCKDGRFGNPFEIGKDGTREEVIAKYRKWLKTQPKLVETIKRECKGKVLVCFCKPRACHGDVIFGIANHKKNKQKRTQEVREVRYGIGVRDENGDFGILAGPFEKEQTALNKAGDKGQYIIRLSEYSDTILYKWNAHTDEWIKYVSKKNK